MDFVHLSKKLVQRSWSGSGRVSLRPVAAMFLLIGLMGINLGSTVAVAQLPPSYTICPDGVLVVSGHPCPAPPTVTCWDGTMVHLEDQCPDEPDGSEESGDSGGDELPEDPDSDGGGEGENQPVTIVTSAADAARVCKQGGFASFVRLEDGTGFRNTGQCVSHVAQGGSILRDGN